MKTLVTRIPFYFAASEGKVASLKSRPVLNSGAPAARCPLPARGRSNDPAVTGIYAQSADNVYAIGNGNLQDSGGPTVVLHYDGHRWSKVAQASLGYGTLPSQQISSDGHGGLWLPMPGLLGAPSYLMHYGTGSLTSAGLPGGAQSTTIESIAAIPGTSELLAGGFTHTKGNRELDVTAIVIQYG